jgi:hypothetical protein
MKCLACSGSGWIRTEVPMKMYDCGMATVARFCRACHGTGETTLTVAIDNKSAAAGEVTA